MEDEPLKKPSAALGRKMKEIREVNGVRQEQVARAARDLGLGWNRATVAALEGGHRQFTLEEFFLLPRVLKGANCYATVSGALISRFAELSELLEYTGWVQLTESTCVTTKGLQKILAGKAKNIGEADLRTEKSVPGHLTKENERLWKRFWGEKKADFDVINRAQRDAFGDAEQKLGRKLKVPPMAIVFAALKTWNRTLSEERERRLSEHHGQTSRTLQAHRGHTTRALTHEIVKALKDAGFEPKTK